MRKPNTSLSIDRLKEVLDYDPEAGVFTWKNPTSDRMHVGEIAGRVANGYRAIQIDGVRYYAHRLAWFWMTGEWPEAFVDHKNLCKDDNRWVNLREATVSQNGQNARVKKINGTKLKGVRLDKRRGLFYAGITVSRQFNWLGYFDCPVAAHLAYAVAADKLFGEFARAA